MSTSRALVSRHIAALATLTALLAVASVRVVANVGQSTQQVRVAPAIEGVIEPAAPPLPAVTPATVAADPSRLADVRVQGLAR